MAYCRHSINSKTPPNIADEGKRKLNLIEMQRFIFTVLRSIINASYSRTTINVDSIFRRISIIIADQLQEKQLLCL